MIEKAHLAIDGPSLDILLFTLALSSLAGMMSNKLTRGSRGKPTGWKHEDRDWKTDYWSEPRAYIGHRADSLSGTHLSLPRRAGRLNKPWTIDHRRSMSTTVELKRNTARRLEELKKKYHAKSMDETVKRLISKAENIPESMFGSHPQMKPFEQEDEAGSHEL